MERPLTKHIIPGASPLSLKEYLQVGGYRGTNKALKEMAPAEVTSLVKTSNLLGRGGAGFPTGVLFQLMPYRLKKPIFFFAGHIRKLKQNSEKLSEKLMKPVILVKTF